MEDTANSTAQTVQTITDRQGKYLTFCLARETYGLGILKVQEIIKLMEITAIPKTPEFVRGVINLRGRIIPVLDLRLKFEMDSTPDTEKTCIIVVQVETGENTNVVIGIIVDEVSEVMDISADQIEPPPEFGSDIKTDFILGMGKSEQKVVTLLDIDRVLTTEEILQLKNA